jgi:glucose/mannose-6-phosphate isomerase
VVLCASYSGDTEETLSCYAAAGAAGIERVVLTTGGELAARARADGVKVVGVPSGMQPRAAVVYMTVGALELAALSGASPPFGDEIDGAADLLTRLIEEWGPDSPTESPAERLARGLQGKLPVIFGAGATAAPAIRWKTQLNENAQWPAFAAALPEADHNEICGWGRDVAPLTAVLLDDPGLEPRLRTRVEVTAGELASKGRPVERVEAAGETPLERVLSLVLLGDLVSVYLAVLERTDPTPVEAIEELKAALADAGKP